MFAPENRPGETLWEHPTYRAAYIKTTSAPTRPISMAKYQKGGPFSGGQNHQIGALKPIKAVN